MTPCFGGYGVAHLTYSSCFRGYPYSEGTLYWKASFESCTGDPEEIKTKVSIAKVCWKHRRVENYKALCCWLTCMARGWVDNLWLMLQWHWEELRGKAEIHNSILPLVICNAADQRRYIKHKKCLMPLIKEQMVDHQEPWFDCSWSIHSTQQ